jgi:hypothetical protein
MMVATGNISRNERFNLPVDVVPPSIAAWRRASSSGDEFSQAGASADSDLLPENRRQRIVEDPSRRKDCAQG